MMTDEATPLAPIAWARSMGERKGMRSVIVLQELPDGRWGYTSWGRNKADCGRARRIADNVYDMLGVAAAMEDDRG